MFLLKLLRYPLLTIAFILIIIAFVIISILVGLAIVLSGHEQVFVKSNLEQTINNSLEQCYNITSFGDIWNCHL